MSEISLVGLQSAIFPPWIRIQCQVSKDTEPETIMLVNFEHKTIGYHLIQNIEAHCKYLVKLSFKAGHIICVKLERGVQMKHAPKYERLSSLKELPMGIIGLQ